MQTNFSLIVGFSIPDWDFRCWAKLNEKSYLFESIIDVCCPFARLTDYKIHQVNLD